MRRLMSLLFGVLLLMPLAARAQQINLTVTNIPTSATRVVAVVDGRGITGSLRASQDVTTGAGSSSLALGVPSGGPYRIRAIAYTAGGVFPAILRSGKTTGIAVGSAGTLNASVNLADVSFSVDPTTPSSANAGANVTVNVDIVDPGDFLDGVSSGELWSGTSAPTQNLKGAPTSGTLKSLGSGAYEFSTAVNLPTTGSNFYSQFVASSFGFDNPNGTEAPLLVWPNLPASTTPPQIALSGNSGINLTVTNIPANATRLVAVVDTGTNTGPLRTSQDVSPGVGSSTFFVGLPAGTGYRVRVIAFIAGSMYPAILRSGKATGISITSGTTNASVALADVSGAVDPSTPSMVAAGQSVTIKFNLTDLGDFLDGGLGSLQTSSSPPLQNSGGLGFVGGSLVSSGGGAYQFVVNFPFTQQVGALYYQFVANSSAFSDLGVHEYPSLFWPNLETGAQAPYITVVSPNQLFVSVGNIPSTATSLTASVDSGGIGVIVVSQTLSPGIGSSSNIGGGADWRPISDQSRRYGEYISSILCSGEREGDRHYGCW
jgi:hypothetical protein